MPLTANEMGDEGLAQLSKRINRARLQTRIPVPSHSFKSREKGSTEDSINFLVKQYESLEILEMIQWIPRPIISLEMGDLEVCRHGLLHYSGDKRWADIDAEPVCPQEF